ncbi:FAD-binding oxidoreductase [Curvibacter sp. APW13]|uniref:NAD(P)/FAD-dependent oxidoreductase n=1 Tax=Curvibacter sp. APW13 TaxID=3077236 RepID=UPI0028E06B95|nr:FAD-binding oxidoreductase [Curvibacter sp. APW13]MDT8991255.1 FAD-binding oxidoreductase [Curvibacter sp. APW13]
MLLKSDTQLNQRSYYEASVQRTAALAPLDSDVRADVVVIGAGFAGLSAAIECAQRGMTVVVLEADRICSGASGRNGGQAIVGYASGQGPFDAQLGPEASRLAWEMSLEAVDLIDERIAQFGIDCDREFGYLYVAETARKARALEADMRAMEDRWGLKSQFVRGAQTRSLIDSPLYQAAAYERRSGHLHPLKYGLGLARAAQSLGVKIHEYSAVTDLQRGDSVVARTAKGSVTASYGVLAGNCTLPEHGPRVAPEIAARIMPVGTYIIGTQPLDAALCQRLIPSNAAVCDNNFVLDYYRFSADRRMLFGGRVSYSARTPADLQQVMGKRLAQVFPQLAGVPIDYVWGGFVDISMNRAPDFGRLGSNLYYLQGFSGHGVAITGLAGRLVAQAIGGQAQRLDVFARLRHRKFPGGTWLRTPSLVLGMAYHQIMDML